MEAEVDFFFVFCREGRKRGGEVKLAYRGLLSLSSSLYLFDHANLNTNKFSSFDHITQPHLNYNNKVAVD